MPRSRASPILLFALLCAALSAAHAAGGDQGKADAEVRLAPAIAPQIIIAPTEVRSDPTLVRGCWVRLFPQTDYQGLNDLTVAGPAELPSLHTPIGDVYWKQKAESLIVGPKASVTVFEEQSFRGPTVALGPGTRQPQLRKDLKLMQSIDSLKIACGK